MSTPARTPSMAFVPLALFALGLCLFLIAGAFGRFVQLGAFIPYGIFTGGVGLIVAGIFALREDSAFGGAAFTLLGTFFAGTAFYQWFFFANSKAPDADLAWIALGWTVFALALAVGSFRQPLIPGPGKILYVGIFLGFLLAWINGAFHMDWARTGAGIVGIIAAILAWAGGLVTLRAGGPQSGA